MTNKCLSGADTGEKPDITSQMRAVIGDILQPTPLQDRNGAQKGLGDRRSAGTEPDPLRRPNWRPPEIMRWKACGRAARRPALTFASVRAGPGRITFQGRLSRHRRLAPGTYKLTLTTKNASGEATSHGIMFTIVTR
jgi:hypothetical protein